MDYSLENDYLKVSFQTTGGALTSILDKEGVEYLWQGDGTYWSGQAPVLFPICGSIREEKAILSDGTTITMPRHGIVRKKEFECVALENDHICFAIASDDVMKQQYPFDFQLKIKYTLIENKIITEYIVINESQKEMPFQIGGHPGFRCPLFPTEAYNDYCLTFDQEETLTVPRPVTETGLIDVDHRTSFLHHQKKLPLNHELFSKDAIILDELQSRKVTLASCNHTKTITMDFEQFPYLVLWSTANKGPFIAIEPWTGLSTCSDENDQFEQKRNMQFVQPKDKNKYQFSITIQE